MDIKFNKEEYKKEMDKAIPSKEAVQNSIKKALKAFDEQEELEKKENTKD